MTIQTNREKKRNQWLKTVLGNGDYQLSLVADDASFRRYWRLHQKESTLILMDSPPDKENNNAFVSCAKWLKKQGIAVPNIYYRDDKHGFFLLSDLGNTTLLDVVQTEENRQIFYYQKAIDTLVSLQKIDISTAPLKTYSNAQLSEEMWLFNHWYLLKNRHIKITDKANKALVDLFKQLSQLIGKQPQVCCHRDYHSRNLMVQPDQSLAVIDFQDSVIGAYSYDLVSLLKDAYFQLSDKNYKDLINYYNQQSDIKTTVEDIDFMTVQRQLKVLGIFTRLSVRDGKHGYLKNIALVKHYLSQVIGKYDNLQILAQWL